MNPTHYRPRPLALLFFLAALLVSSLSHRSVSADSADEATDGKTVKLLQIQRYPSYFHRSQPLTPEPDIILRFSGPVTTKAVSEALSFQDRKSGREVTAKVKRPRAKAVEEMQPWGDDGNRMKLSIDHFVTVTPKTPLATEVSWQLKVAPLKSSDEKHALVQPWLSQLGTLREFRASSIREVNQYDLPHYIQVSLNKVFHEEVDERTIRNSIQVQPEPKNFKIERVGYSLHLKGDFEFGRKYQVTVFRGLKAYDETRLISDQREEVVFTHRNGFVSLPTFSKAQSAAGRKRYEILMGNLKNLRVRVKQLKDRDLAYALRGYQKVYNGHGDKKTVPFEMVPGEIIYDQTHTRTAEIDHSEKIHLDWEKLLDGQVHGALYLCVEGWSETEKSRGVGAQSIIQLTDLGLAWKRERESLLVYAFSLKTGKPLGNVGLELLGKEAEILGEFQTDANGLSSLPREEFDKATWIGASKGGDRHLMKAFDRYDGIRLWQFSVPYRYDEAEETERRTLLFTDRGVYKPGETVFLKCLSRLSDSDQLLPVGRAAGKAKVRVTDPKGRAVYTDDVELSAHGSFDLGFDLPEENALGYYHIMVDFNDPKKETRNPYRLQFRKSFQVAEYRPNTFEIEVDTSTVAESKTDFSLPVSANYYMGKPLSKARLSWRASARATWPRVKGFEEFRFGNLIDRRESFSASESVDLSDSGTGLIEFTVPESKESPAPLRVGVSAEITDLNQQTIVKNESFIVDSSDFYLGVRAPEGLIRAGEEAAFGLVAARSNGEVIEEPVEATLKVDRLTYHTVKVKGAGGRITNRTETERKEVLNRLVSIETRFEVTTGLPIPGSASLSLAEAGDYEISFSARDGEDREAISKMKFRIVGADEPSWSWHDGIKIGLTPDKESYRVGETAKLLVQSPVLGHALLTVERAGVKKTEIRRITEHESVIEVPIEAGAAPNLFASVLIIRGAAQSPHEHPETDYRVGYCQLKVEDPKTVLQVAIEKEGKEPFRLPGSEQTLGALVTDHRGQPVRGAEVCLYAVDEGVLSLTGYSTPEPKKTFHVPFPLGVMTGQTISDLLPEDPKELDFGNKGYVIGGGGPGGASINPSEVRKDFRSLAFWRGSLVTDKEGRVRTTFTAPDSLTSYRVMAVVCEGNRFGSGEDRLTINKPLMLEPALPAFGNAGDQLDLSAVLHNNTEAPMELEVRIELDAHADFLPEVEGIVPTSFSRTKVKDQPDLRVRRVTLAAGETGKIGFPVLFTRKGEAAWRWRAVSTQDPSVVDSVESKLEIGYPMPLLREMFSVSLKKKGASENLIAEVDPRVLSRSGEVNVTVSNSRVLEALDALEYLLRYPYGCVEQTTSSTLPWLSTQHIRGAVPQLSRTDAEIKEAIERGTNRLLSMQTSEGGLSYWPGGKEPMLWGSAYGGMALALAGRQGIDLPEERLEALWEYLSQQMRNTAKLKNTGDLYHRTLAAYTLALAGKPEPSYHELLYGRRKDLSLDARALLALAMMETASDEKKPDAVLKERVTELLTVEESDEKDTNSSHWYRKHYGTCMQLLAWSRWDAQNARTAELLDELLGVPKGRAAWGSTYLNSWGVMAVTENAMATASALEGTTCKVTFGDQSQEVVFGKELAGELIQFEFDQDSRDLPLNVTLGSSARVYTHVEVAGYPEIVPREPENHGLGIQRTYHQLGQDGTVSEIESLEVGDLILVTLHLAIPEEESFHYLAIDDPLPSVFEAVNPSFETQKGSDQSAYKGDWKRLYCNHRELRTERALFFCDYLHRGGHYAVQYLARVVAPGEVTAPPAKIEAMYEPQRFGLSGTVRLSSLPLKLKGKPGQVAKN